MAAKLFKKMPQDVTQNITEVAAFCNCHRKFGVEGTPTANLFCAGWPTASSEQRARPPPTSSSRMVQLQLSPGKHQAVRHLKSNRGIDPHLSVHYAITRNIEKMVLRMDLTKAYGDLSNKPVDQTKWQCEYCDPLS